MKISFSRKCNIFLLGLVTIFSTIITPLQIKALENKPFEYLIRSQLNDNKQSSTITIELQNNEKIDYQSVNYEEKELLLSHSSTVSTTSMAIHKNGTYLFYVNYTIDGELQEEEIVYKEENIIENGTESDSIETDKVNGEITSKVSQEDVLESNEIDLEPKASGKVVGISSNGIIATDQKWFIFGEANTITGYLKDGAPSDIVIPEYYENDKGVQTPILYIADNAFSGLEINSIVLNSNLETIGSDSFANTKITDLSIPESVTTISKNTLSFTNLVSLTIGANVPQDIYLPNTLTNVVLKDTVTQPISFKGLTNLVNVTLSNHLPTIISSMFKGCASLQSIRIPSSVTDIGDAFDGCASLREVIIDANNIAIPAKEFYDNPALEIVTINGTLTSIGESAFEKCKNLTTLNMQKGVGIVEKKAFALCGRLQGAIFKEGTTSIHNTAFLECNGLRELAIPSTIGKIEDYKFKGLTGLQKVTLAEGINEIGKEAFAQCSSIISLNIPESITSIGDSAFESCRNLKDITLSSTLNLTKIGSKSFYECGSLTEIVIPDSVTSIGQSAFAECSGMKKLTLSSKMQVISVNLFENCTSLESILFKEGLQTISNEAFKGCTKLNNVVFPNSLNEIKESAFKDCIGLEKLSLNENLQKIGDFAFSGNTSLKSLALNKELYQLGVNAFEKCSSLVTLTIGENLTTIGSKAFLACSSLETLNIPATVITIENSAFANCVKLVNITLNEGVMIIGDFVFSGITAEEITVPGTVISIGDSAFKSSTIKNIYLPNTPVSGVTGAPWGAYFATVSWEGGVVIDSCFYFEKNDTGYTVSAMKDEMHEGCEYYNDHRNLIIPEIWQGEPVTKIGDNAFTGTYIEGITIPDTVIAIGNYSFSRCPNLYYIEIPKSVITIGNYCFFDSSNLSSIKFSEGLETIGEYAFASSFFDYSNSLISITLPSSLKTIGNHAFEYCGNLERVTLKEGLEKIGDYAFSYSDIYELTIPSSVSYLGDYAFSHCEYLDMVKLNEGLKRISSECFSHCTRLSQITIPASVEIIEEWAFYNCNSLEIVTLTETSNNHGNLKTIEDLAFDECVKLRSINLLEGLETIGKAAFKGHTLENITIPSTIKNIDFMAFESASDVNNLIFAEGLESINTEGEVFNGCSFETVYIPVSMKTISSILQNVVIKTLVIPEGVENIAPKTFNNSSVVFTKIPGTIKDISNLKGGNYKKIIIDEGVQIIGFETFYKNDYIEEVSIPLSLSLLDGYAFVGCLNLKTVTLAEGITDLGDGTFLACSSLSEIKLPDSLTKISVDTFASCRSLTKINIENIIEFKSSAFEGCKSLVDVKLNPDTTVLEDSVFENCASLKEITIPNTIDVLSSSLFRDCVSLETVLLPTITSIEYSAFENCQSLETIQLTEGLESIGNRAFKDCIKLKSVAMPDSLIEIDDSAFKNCIRFTKIELPSKITKLNNSVFEDCSSLESVSVPSGVTEFGNSTFKNCVKFNKADIPYGVTKIGSSTFEGCTSLTSMPLPNSVKTIGNLAFKGCNTLVSITLSSSLTDLGSSALEGCTSLAAIELPNSLEKIGDSAFKDCHLIDYIKLTDKLTEIGNEAFSNTKIKTLSMPLSLQKLSSTSLSNMSELKAVYIDLLRINCPYASNEPFGTVFKNVHYKGDFAEFSYTVEPISNSHNRRINYQFDAGLNTGLLLDVTKPDGTKILGISARSYKNHYVADMPGTYEFSARTTTNDEFPYVAFVEDDMGEVDISSENFTINKELLKNATLLDLYTYADVKAVDRDTKESLVNTLEANKTLDIIKKALVNGGDVSEVKVKATSTMNKSNSTTFRITLTDEILYKVDFQVKNDQGTDIDKIIETRLIKNNGILVEPSLIENDDYIIKSWYTDESFTNDKKWDFTSGKVTSDMVLYANYIQKTYGIDYVTGKESSGISVAPKNNFTWSSKNLLPVNVGTIPGYMISHWKYNDVLVTNDTLYSELSTNRNNHSRITLKAVWKPLKNYKVQYELDGGNMMNNAPDVIDNMAYNEEVSLPQAEKAHYKFKGWTYADTRVSEGTTYKDLAKDENKDSLVLYAIWESEGYEVRFEYKGSVPQQQPPATVIKKYQETVEEPSIVSSCGYIFKGWYEDEGCTKEYDFKSKVDHTMTLYGKWELEKYEVVFHSNGGSSVESVKEVEYKTKVMEPSKPKKKGYEFEGWYRDESLKNAWDFNNAVEGNMDLYAKWKLQEYKIGFELDGGVNHPTNPSMYTIKSADITLGSPTKKGHKFIGWKWDGQEAPQENVTLKKGSTGDIVYTAVWQKNKYEVTFDSQGGSTIEAQKVEYLEKVQKPDNPTRKGHAFKGWYLEKECITYYDFGSKVDYTMTLYGKWEKKAESIYPIDPSDPSPPETSNQEGIEKDILTGDTNKLMIWTSLAITCFSAVLILFSKKCKLMKKR
ncbi:leucine-rich repeat protein [Amedibacillus sp. YH-ame6]